MQRRIHAVDPVTEAGLAVITATITATVQANLAQLSNDDVVKTTRQEFVRLHSLSRSDADTARYELRRD